MDTRSKDLYRDYEEKSKNLADSFNPAAAFMGQAGKTLENIGMLTCMPWAYYYLAHIYDASSTMLKRAVKEYQKPEFGLKETIIGDKNVSVTEEVVADKAFGSLLHFRRDTDRNDPKVLIVAPMSGHYASQMTETVKSLLPNHDVYVVDWKNARDVPLSKGDFGFDDYVRYVRDFIRETGPETHVFGVSQSTVPLLAVAALEAAEESAFQPLSMTLISGPIDTHAGETAITRFAESKPVKWFSENLISEVPEKYAGAKRLVYAGFLQLAGLMSLDMGKHVNMHRDLFNHLSHGNVKEAEKIEKIYDGKFAVSDSTEKFYIDTIRKVFIEHDLVKGKMFVDGVKVDPSAIRKTFLLTVEGGKDDIVAPGQTSAAQGLCSGLDPRRKFHYLNKNADHYAIFSGDPWRKDVMPRVAALIRESALSQGITYDPLTNQSIMPDHWIANDGYTSKPARASVAKKAVASVIPSCVPVGCAA
ncbi:MAG: polyhydroxyalkanoate depolymerase [Pseudomonadota bacterium]